MSPDRDHTDLFLAPASTASPAGEPADGRKPAVDGSAAAMDRLRHPFAVQTVRTGGADTSQ